MIKQMLLDLEKLFPGKSFKMSLEIYSSAHETFFGGQRKTEMIYILWAEPIGNVEFNSVQHMKEFIEKLKVTKLLADEIKKKFENKDPKSSPADEFEKIIKENYYGTK